MGHVAADKGGLGISVVFICGTLCASITNSGCEMIDRLILILTYSTGLRVSEVVKLKLGDIDIQRGLIHVKGAKGRKDGYTMLSDVVIETLDLYLKAHRPRDWLFPGKSPVPISQQERRK